MFDKIKAAWAALVEKVRGWRTVAFNVLASAPFALDALSAIDMGALLGDKGKAVYGLVVLAVNIYLRSITTTPVGAKVQP